MPYAWVRDIPDGVVPVNALITALEVDITMLNEAGAQSIFFAACQMSFVNASNVQYGANHLGLQWNSGSEGSVVGHKAVNWGGYVDPAGASAGVPFITDGSFKLETGVNYNTSTFVPRVGAANAQRTCAWDFSVGVPVRFRVELVGNGTWRCSINGVRYRDSFYPGTTHMDHFVVWTEFEQIHTMCRFSRWKVMLANGTEYRIGPVDIDHGAGAGERRVYLDSTGIVMDVNSGSGEVLSSTSTATIPYVDSFAGDAVNIRRGGAWISSYPGAIFVKRNSAWQGATAVLVKRNGAWVDTGYTGPPGAPPTPQLVSETYNQIVVRAAPPTTGAPTTTMTVQLLNSTGTTIHQQVSVAPGANATFNGLAIDTNYIIRSYANAGQVLSAASPDLHRRTGHPEQTSQVPIAGYSSLVNYMRPLQINGSSEYQPPGTYPGANAVDPGGGGSSWVSDANTDPGFYEALRLEVSGNRYYRSVQVFGPGAQTIWLGIFENVNFSWIPGPSVFNGVHNQLIFQHPYWAGIGNGLYNKTFGFGVVKVQYFDVAVTGLQSWPLAYRAQIDDVIVGYSDWTFDGGGYQTVVTVAFAPNTSW